MYISLGSNLLCFKFGSNCLKQGPQMHREALTGPWCEGKDQELCYQKSDHEQREGLKGSVAQTSRLMLLRFSRDKSSSTTSLS